MMKRIERYMGILAVMIGLSGCLDYQDSYDYEPKNKDHLIYMSAWDFINVRQDVFSLLKQAIEYTELTGVYTQTEQLCTYLLLDNTAMATIMTNAQVSNVTDMDKESLKNVLLYHTVDGYYHGVGTLSFDPVYVVTLWRSQDAIMTLKLDNTRTYTRYSTLLINDGLGSSTLVRATTSNLLATNGAIHVISKQVIYKP